MISDPIYKVLEFSANIYRLHRNNSNCFCCGFFSIILQNQRFIRCSVIYRLYQVNYILTDVIHVENDFLIYMFELR